MIKKAYDAVLYGMAYAAGLLMAAMMVVITLDVVLRNLGYQSSAHFFTFTEYALLIVPCLGAPWLAREKGHIYVEILLMAPIRIANLANLSLDRHIVRFGSGKDAVVHLVLLELALAGRLERHAGQRVSMI